jgi:short subunit dehydrogenase-like uncharacterized protein
MNGARSWMLYGGAGHTGALIARHAHQHGHRPLLAGRSGPAIAALAGQLESAICNCLSRLQFTC